MKALLLANNEAGKEIIEQVSYYLQHNGWEVEGHHLNSDLSEATADFVVVCGGDGSILGVGRRMGENQIPIVGVNSGKLGYLASFSVEDFGKFCGIPDRDRDRYHISKRVMLHIYEPISFQHPMGFLAVNDLVIDIGPPFRTVEIGITIGGEFLSNVRGDGIIISTPTGSTAYNLSAGGPIIHPELDAIALTPKNPHRLSIRPIVVHSRDEIVIDVNQQQDGGVYAIIDGQHHVQLPKKCKVRVRRAEEKIGIVQNIGSWKTLTEKLHWGE